MVLAVNPRNFILLVEIDALESCKIRFQLRISLHLLFQLTGEHVPLIIIAHDTLIGELKLPRGDLLPVIFYTSEYLPQFSFFLLIFFTDVNFRFLQLLVLRFYLCIEDVHLFGVVAGFFLCCLKSVFLVLDDQTVFQFVDPTPQYS